MKNKYLILNKKRNKFDNTFQCCKSYVNTDFKKETTSKRRKKFDFDDLNLNMLPPLASEKYIVCELTGDLEHKNI